MNENVLSLALKAEKVFVVIVLVVPVGLYMWRTVEFHHRQRRDQRSGKLEI